MEEHGPYLPAFTDGYLSQRLAADLALAIAARPGWKALVFPQIPLGSEGYNSPVDALDQASDFFHDTYGGRMVHL